MTHDDPLLEALARANPVPDGSGGDPAGEERVLRRVRTAPAPAPARARARARVGDIARLRGLIAPALVLAVTALVVLVVVRAGVDHGRAAAGRVPARPASGAVLRVAPTAAVPHVTPPVLAEVVASVRARLAQSGTDIRVRSLSADRIGLTGSDLRTGNPARLRSLLADSPRLSFRDWEADVLLPNGRTLADAQADGDLGAVPVALSGARARALAARHPGSAILLAAGNPSLDAPATGDYVLRGRPALTAGDLVPGSAQVVRQSAGWAIDLSLTPAGARSFQALTAHLARRGEGLPAGTTPPLQHFVVALGDRILAVPQLDFQTYPDGIVTAGEGVTIAGGFTRAGAQRIVTGLDEIGPAVRLALVTRHP